MAPRHLIYKPGRASRADCPQCVGRQNFTKISSGINGSGVAFIDYNNDGFPDIFQSTAQVQLLLTPRPSPIEPSYIETTATVPSRMLRAKAGVGSSGWGQGACVGDYDNDGWDDLSVTVLRPQQAFHNNGDGTFSDVADRRVWPGRRPVEHGLCVVDYDRDGRSICSSPATVNLETASRMPLRPVLVNSANTRACRSERPRTEDQPNHLYRNDGDGKFTDVSETSGIRNTPGHYSLGVLTLDYDGDGWPDIYVACDSAPSILLHNNRDGTFRDVGLSSGTAFNDDGETQAGMGVAAADYDHDGHLDIVKTNFSDDSPNLYQSNGANTFSDRVFDAGLGRLREYLGWGVVASDFDNDGWTDIFIVNGHLTPEIDKAAGDSRFRQRKLLYRNLRNGRFEEISNKSGSGFSELHSSRGAAAADILNDGRMSVFVNELDEPPSLLVPDRESDKSLDRHPYNWLRVE